VFVFILVLAIHTVNVAVYKLRDQWLEISKLDCALVRPSEVMPLWRNSLPPLLLRAQSLITWISDRETVHMY